MFKKINNIAFVIVFLAVLFVPLLFTTWESGGVSQNENRNLAKLPKLIADGEYNSSLTVFVAKYICGIPYPVRYPLFW